MQNLLCYMKGANLLSESNREPWEVFEQGWAITLPILERSLWWWWCGGWTRGGREASQGAAVRIREVLGPAL